MNTQNRTSPIVSKHFRTEKEMFRVVESRLIQTLSLSEPNHSWAWIPITQGGSDRNFYRLQHSNATDADHWIVMQYSMAREENTFYADIARFLRENHLNAPRLIFYDADLQLVVLEDLGDESLHSVYLRQPDSIHLIPLYQAALEQARRLHKLTSAPVRTMKGFDESLYRWERHYFLNYLVHRWASIELEESQRKEIEAEGESLAAELMRNSRCLIHRDFQSQNLMVRENAVWLIDFQGMRPGHAAYDVASLLYDPYVSLSHSRRAALLQWYAPTREFEHSFYQAAIQRLMQALGAYGFLGLVKGKRRFLQHIPRGLENLADVLSHFCELPRTQELVQQIQIEIKDHKGSNS